MKIKRDDGALVEADTVLECLSLARVFKVVEMEEGQFLFEENCDGAFGVILSKEQVALLAGELLTKVNL